MPNAGGLPWWLNPTGMAWRYSYKPRGIDPATGGRPASRTFTLGKPETHSPEAARTEAGKLKGEVQAGGSPAEKRKAAIAANRAAEAEAAKALTFGELINAWATARTADRRPSYLREAGNCLRRNLSQWLDRPAKSITLAEAVHALDEIKAEKGTVAANRTQAYARAAYSWALKRQMLTANPFRGIERPGRETARERVLTAEEMGAIWQACDALPPVRAAFVRVLMLTMQRRDEVASMRWAELDLDKAIWTLPGERAKNRRTHVVHLADPARAILAGSPVQRDNPCVFAGRGRAGAIGAFSKTKAILDTALAEAGHKLGDWRFHDFRRSGVTELARIGFPPHVCDRILNHVTGAIQGVAAVYQRFEFLDQRKAALDAWAAQVIAAAEGRQPTSNVVPIRADAA